MPDVRAAGPFSRWERSVARRYLFAKRKNGGVALIAVISFCAVMLAVFALITVMSVMNGFRAELLGRIVGFNGHLYAQSPLINGPDRDTIIRRIKAAPGVIQAAPMVEAQAMVIGPTQVTGAIVRGVTPSDLRHMSLISSNIKKGSLQGFGQGDYGGDIVLIGDRMAQTLGVQPGDPITLISPTGPATAFGTSTREKNYIVGGLFSVGMSQFDEAFIYMPLEQAQLFFGRDTSVDYVEIKVDDPDKAKEYKHDVEIASGPGALVTDWQDKNHSYFTALQVERKVMRLILFCIVAIATLNIISSLVMLVKNKTQATSPSCAPWAPVQSARSCASSSCPAPSIGVAGTLCGPRPGPAVLLPTSARSSMPSRPCWSPARATCSTPTSIMLDAHPGPGRLDRWTVAWVALLVLQHEHAWPACRRPWTRLSHRSRGGAPL